MTIKQIIDIPYCPSDMNTLGLSYKTVGRWRLWSRNPVWLPSFEKVLKAANDYGEDGSKIMGVELKNHSSGTSIDEIVCQHSYTYIDKGELPWQKSQS